MDLSEKIQIDLVPEEELTLESFINDISEDFNKEDYLLSGKFALGESDGTFTSNLWAFENELGKTNNYIDFKDLQGLRFKGLKEDDVSLIKCWLADYFLNGYTLAPLQTKYRNLVNFLDTTGNFSNEFLKENKGNNMDFLKRDEVTEKTVYDCVSDIIEYIYFREDIGFKINTNTTIDYLQGLESLCGNLDKHVKSRDIPNNSDALRFGYYIDLFFNDSSIPQDLKTFYMPLLIWWKISNVIPIRPSEICTKMDRDCLKPEGSNIYIKINRVKRSKIDKRSKYASLPTLNRLQVSKEIHDMIFNYIELTEEYGETKTLFSYSAQAKLRIKLSNQHPFMGISWLAEHLSMQKKNFEYFTSHILDTLLKSFYKNIIQDYYNDTLIKEFLRLHDTRHYAFTSLMLQGLTPVEMALIGGHVRVISQSDYQCNISYYIDNEIVNFVNAKKLEGEFSNTSLKKIVFSMPEKCPEPIGQCSKTDDHIGYCTIDFKNENISCDNEEFCFKCSKWWCAPTEYNYDLLKLHIKNECIAPLEKKVAAEELYLEKLIATMNPINLDGLLRSDADDERDYKTAVMGLKSDVDTLIDLKEILLDLTSSEQIHKEQEMIG